MHLRALCRTETKLFLAVNLNLQCVQLLQKLSMMALPGIAVSLTYTTCHARGMHGYLIGITIGQELVTG